MEMGERQAIYQVSTLQALARGNYYGSTDMETLLIHGGKPMVALVDLLQQMLHDPFLTLSEVAIFIPNLGLNVLHFRNYCR